MLEDLYIQPRQLPAVEVHDSTTYGRTCGVGPILQWPGSLRKDHSFVHPRIGCQENGHRTRGGPPDVDSWGLAELRVSFRKEPETPFKIVIAYP